MAGLNRSRLGVLLLLMSAGFSTLPRRNVSLRGCDAGATVLEGPIGAGFGLLDITVLGVSGLSLRGGRVSLLLTSGFRTFGEAIFRNFSIVFLASVAEFSVSETFSVLLIGGAILSFLIDLNLNLGLEIDLPDMFTERDSFSGPGTTFSSPFFCQT
jgi:hypothetical protein